VRNFIAPELFFGGAAHLSTHLGIPMFDDRSGPGAALFSVPLSGPASPIRPGFVVAVPVKDEEERLPACLRALAQQRDQLGQPIPPTLVRIVVFANNCSDRSASLARKLGGGLSATSALSKLDCLRPTTPAPPVAR
jgi:hypothetical protein